MATTAASDPGSWRTGWLFARARLFVRAGDEPAGVREAGHLRLGYSTRQGRSKRELVKQGLYEARPHFAPAAIRCAGLAGGRILEGSARRRCRSCVA